ncbi:hypothetical protein CIG2463D_0987 [Campylobacter iguaniorum]|uniref:hypothetical protein n=1 Tax=Campylobacter iguaniorum TaxID=1244531 RepID=UPI00073A52CD|nr:hypothetical protein [Campylobacter iguaniorum]ALV24560.1 hypothetical protein CIG2463D_0987 [Campylobacter iguaniorum]
MKYKINYNQLIAGKHYKENSEVEFNAGTDRNFIARLITIKAIEEIKEPKSEVKKDKPAKEKANDTNQSAKE